MSPEQLVGVWADYKLAFAADPESQKTNIVRNQLAQHYLYCVRYQAERIHARLPSEVELSDLIQAGSLGMMDAMKVFDLQRKVKFETYSAPRIRGSILDYLRSMDWVPRLVRSRSSKLTQATKELWHKLGREPTKKDIAKHLSMTSDEVDKLFKDGNATKTVSLSRKYFETDSNKEVREVDILEDKRAPQAFDTILTNDMREFMLKGLNRSERLIIVLYYYESMTMKEIGDVLDLSESRVSQMHSSIIARLRAVLGDKGLRFPLTKTPPPSVSN